jgi:hypothetical protein
MAVRLWAQTTVYLQSPARRSGLRRRGFTRSDVRFDGLRRYFTARAD